MLLVKKAQEKKIWRGECSNDPKKSKSGVGKKKKSCVPCACGASMYPPTWTINRTFSKSEILAESLKKYKKKKKKKTQNRNNHSYRMRIMRIIVLFAYFLCVFCHAHTKKQTKNMRIFFTHSLWMIRILSMNNAMKKKKKNMNFPSRLRCTRFFSLFFSSANLWFFLFLSLPR